MSEFDVLAVIAVASLLLGLIVGVVMYRADFCVTAMFRDLFLLRDGFMLRQLFVLVFVSMLLFESGRLADWIQTHPFPLLGALSLGSLIGGVLFWIGIVLAGGCVVGTLYKMGSGSALSLTAFVGMLAGSTVYAELHSIWSAFAETTRLSPALTLPQLLQLSPVVLLPVAVLMAGVIYRWYQHGLLVRAGYVTGYLQPFHAAMPLGMIGFSSYLVIGMPRGITTLYTKLGSSIEALIVPEHINQLKYLNTTLLNYNPPFALQSISGGAGPAWDGIAAIQYPLIAGIILGALLYSLTIREFAWHYRVPFRDYVSAAAGGLLLAWQHVWYLDVISGTCEKACQSKSVVRDRFISRSLVGQPFIGWAGDKELKQWRQSLLSLKMLLSWICEVGSVRHA